MLYLIGLGLNENSISKQGLEAIKKCRRIYLENYTSDFPYKINELKKLIGKKIILAGRDFVESMEFLKEAKKKNIALLVYGSPLTATTHISLIQEALKNKIKFEVIHNASILDAVAETGLQLYKFGKIASMPKYQKNFTPESFIEIIKENQKINAHTLILIDIGLDILQALRQIEASAKNKKIKINKIIVCQSLGTKNQKIFYGRTNKLKNEKIKKPYCIIIPSRLHFIEKEILEEF